VTDAMPRAPRLIHVTTTDMSLALLLGPQLEAFTAAGYEVMGASAPGRFVADLERRGIRHLPLKHATRAQAPHRDAGAIFELRSLFREIGPDIVHTHNPKPGVYGRLAARWARVPVVVNTIHGLYAQPSDPWTKRAFVYGLERLASTCSDAELVQSPEDLQVLEKIGVPRRKLTELGNGIDLARFDPDRIDASAVAAARRELGVGPEHVVCGAVGRLVWEKGYRELFDAAARLARRVPELRLVVVGPRDEAKRDALTDADIRRAEATANIRFLGLRDDMDRLYAAMDLYVLASHREGWPRSAMEAAAMGVPVIATDTRGCRQVVDHGSTGLLVPPRDGVALAAAIESLAGDAELRTRMGTAARRKARNDFDQQRVIDITLDVYRRLLPSAAGVRAAT
jgi:glycosyltransferase involved in cell wall biosynthesis